MKRTKWSLALTAHDDAIDSIIRDTVMPSPRQRIAAYVACVRDFNVSTNWFRLREHGSTPQAIVAAWTRIEI